MSGIYTSPVSQSADARPIGPYVRSPVALRPWDPRVTTVAERVIGLIQSRRPDLHVEHIGSTAVPGLRGKGIVDLGAEADPAEIPAITKAMYGLGFEAQPGPDPWPPTRPMHVGSYALEGREFRVHFHVHPRGGDLPRDVRFRDALRADPALAASYARIKTEIVEGAAGPVDRVVYQDAKGEWIVDTVSRLGIAQPVTAGSGAKEEGL